MAAKAATAARREGRGGRSKEKQGACFVLKPNDKAVYLVNKQIVIDRKPREVVVAFFSPRAAVFVCKF